MTDDNHVTKIKLNGNHYSSPLAVVRSEKVQRRLDATENKKRFDIIEALHAEVTAEVEREYEAKRKESFALPKREISLIDDAEELWQRMECSYDAESFEVTEIYFLHFSRIDLTYTKFSRMN